MPRLILAIESSCDETAAAIVAEDGTVLSSIVASQEEQHRPFGGVVPEIASRAHLEDILPVIQAAMNQANCRFNDVVAIGVMTEPGLVGSLLVGLTAAKTLAMVLDVPLIAINHIHAHLYACQMAVRETAIEHDWPDDQPRTPFPAIGLVVSGGHTNLYHCRSATEYELIGSTIDDAAGEAFDKAAAMLGLSYPGGPEIQKAAIGGNPTAFKFPRSFINDERLAFSFSGLKTSLKYTAQGQPGAKESPPELTEKRISDLAASFQAAVVDVLISKCKQALEKYGLNTLCIGGGVAANQHLRDQLEHLSFVSRTKWIAAPMELCTDNAAMGAIAWELYRDGQFADLDVDVTPGLIRHKG